MNHHPSCKGSDKYLVWHCAQCGLDESAESMLNDLESCRRERDELEKNEIEIKEANDGLYMALKSAESRLASAEKERDHHKDWKEIVLSEGQAQITSLTDQLREAREFIQRNEPKIDEIQKVLDHWKSIYHRDTERLRAEKESATRALSSSDKFIEEVLSHLIDTKWRLEEIMPITPSFTWLEERIETARKVLALSESLRPTESAERGKPLFRVNAENEAIPFNAPIPNGEEGKL